MLGDPSRNSRGIGSLASRARQPERARAGGEVGGVVVKELVRFDGAAKVVALYRRRRRTHRLFPHGDG